MQPAIADPISPSEPRLRPVPGAPPRRLGRTVLEPWLRAQAVNVNRHAAALRPFRQPEFGTPETGPSEGHIQAVNRLMSALRTELLKHTAEVNRFGEAALGRPETATLQRVVIHKEHAHDWVRSIERVWDFYFELFGQRQTRVAEWLLSCDRIGLDCYQVCYMGVGKAKSIPAPPPFAYMRTGFSPATFRRGIPLRRLGRLANPFPLIELPYHRLVNPWTLGAVLHEVCHNLQNELGLARAIPQAVARRLTDAGLPRQVASTWTRWNRETFADLGGLLLGGPAVVGSLMDVIGRSPSTVFGYTSRAPHPTPYLRAFVSIELLRRMGFEEPADRYGRMWSRMYPAPPAGSIPEFLVRTFPQAIPLVVDAMCYRPFRALGGKSLSQVIPFAQKEQRMIEEAAGRLAAGTDPGVIPARFLVGAARFALDNRLARPGAITKNFYTELVRR